MRTILTAVAALAAVILMVVSAALNYRFMAGMGRTVDEALLLGAAAVAGDLLKACLPFFIALAWRARRRSFVVLGGGTFVILTAVSLVAALGYAADARGGQSHQRRSQDLALAHAERELAHAQRHRTSLAAIRPASVIETDIDRLQQDRLWTTSAACSTATTTASRSLCSSYHGLRGELAAARAAEEAERAVVRLVGEIARLRAAGAGADTEPQVSIIARLSGGGQDAVRTALSVLTALFVELGSGLGLYLAFHHSAPAGWREPHRRPLEPADVDEAIAQIERYALMRLLRAPEAALSTAELAADYAAWCRERNEPAIPQTRFETGFARVAAHIGIRRGREGYLGIAHRQVQAPPITARPRTALLGRS